MITWVHQKIMAQKMSCSELQQANRFVHNLDFTDQIPFGHHVQWYLAHKKQPHLPCSHALLHAVVQPRIVTGAFPNSEREADPDLPTLDLCGIKRWEMGQYMEPGGGFGAPPERTAPCCQQQPRERNPRPRPPPSPRHCPIPGCAVGTRHVARQPSVKEAPRSRHLPELTKHKNWSFNGPDFPCPPKKCFLCFFGGQGKSGPFHQSPINSISPTEANSPAPLPGDPPDRTLPATLLLGG